MIFKYIPECSLIPSFNFAFSGRKEGPNELLAINSASPLDIFSDKIGFRLKYIYFF